MLVHKCTLFETLIYIMYIKWNEEQSIAYVYSISKGMHLQDVFTQFTFYNFFLLLFTEMMY